MHEILASCLQMWARVERSDIRAGICCGDSAGQLVEGQNFLCMSLSVGTVNQVARQLTIPSLSFYDWVLPVWCSQIYPALSPLLSTGAPHRSRCTWSHLTRVYHCLICFADSRARWDSSSSLQCTIDRVGTCQDNLQHAGLMAITCVGITSSDQPMLLSFTTVFGEQLLAFHKPTTPLQPIALYEDVMEPGLGAGVTPMFP